MHSTIYSSEESYTPSRPRPRPWSPDPRDPVPSLRYLGGYQHERHEVSDPSIEAFDLADYARTLNRHPYDPYDGYPSSPPPTRSFSLASHTSSQPPSLVSSRGTPTSHAHSTPSRRYIDHRFSIPVQPPAPTSVHDLPGGVPYSYEPLRRPPNASSSHDVTSTPEIDITHFPSWSHGWYAKEKKWSPIGQLHEPSRASFFDPAYPTAGQTENRYDVYAATSSPSSRDFVPWTDSDTLDYDSPLDPELKQERIRMLEHEFSSSAADPIKPEPIGSVNEKGRLITDGPRKRTASRAIEVLLALVIAAAAIYAALWIKPPNPPPPQSKPQTFALYALSILTALFCFYLFFLRPCYRGGRKKWNVTGTSPGGLAVLPIQELQGNKKKKGKKGMQGNVQVNLIVDPMMLSPRVGQNDEDNANSDEYLSSSGQTASGKRPKRRSVFEGLALEEQWKAARRDLKWMLFYDAAGLVLWSVEFVWILIRERCPPGGFDGWCNAYNVATAGSCFLGISFGISVFFDVKDLHQSRNSPRTWT